MVLLSPWHTFAKAFEKPFTIISLSLSALSALSALYLCGGFFFSRVPVRQRAVLTNGCYVVVVVVANVCVSVCGLQEEQRADRVLQQNLQLAARMRKLEEANDPLRDIENGGGGGGSHGRLPGGTTAAAGLATQLRNWADKKGLLIVLVVFLLVFWYASKKYDVSF